MKIKHENNVFSVVSNDITNNCKAKYKFRLNETEKPRNMGIETFKKALHILPFSKQEGFYLSCLYEPTINPDFFDMLDLIPSQFRSRVFLTTNLIQKLSDQQIERLAKANINHINISLETFDESLYEELTGVPASETHFYDNLNRVCDIFSKSHFAPELRFITMILKSNCDELVSIAERVRDMCRVEEHTFRVPEFFFGDENSNAALESELLTRQQIDDITRRLFDAGLKNIGVDGRLDIDAYYAKLDRYLNRREIFPDHLNYYIVRINSDGSGLIENSNTRFNLNEIDNPFLFFSEQLAKLQDADSLKLKADDEREYQIESSENDLMALLDEIIVYDKKFIFMRGWAFRPGNISGEDERKYIIFNSGERKILYKTKQLPRNDLAHVCDSKAYVNSGFECLINCDDILSCSTPGLFFDIGIEKDNVIYTKSLIIIPRNSI